MVGYVHDSTTTWKVWNPEFNAVRTQSDVIFDEERNAHISCPEPEEADPLGLPQEEVHVEVLDTEHTEHAIIIIIITVRTTGSPAGTRSMQSPSSSSP